jgi:hypothetical protein
VSQRSRRLVGLGAVYAAGTLVLGLAVAPAVGATGSDRTAGARGPVFHRVAASQLPATAAPSSAQVARQAVSGTASSSAGRTVTVRSRSVAVSKGEQVLQRLKGLVGTANARRPSTSIAVGPQQIVQVSGGAARILVKSTGKALGTTTNLKQFFGITSPGVTVSQPTATFDPVGKRFVLIGIADNGGSTGIVARVSKKSTINAKQSSWNEPFGYADTDAVTESQPKVGVSGDKLVVTARASDPGDASVKNAILVVPKQQLYGATTVGPSAWVASVNQTYDVQVPAVNASSGNPAFVAVPAPNDFTVYTLTGPATTSAPSFSKSVVYPATALVDAPDVPQSGGDTIDLPRAIDSASVSWRQGTLWAGLTVGCTPSGDTGTRACLRVLRIATSGGVSLAADKTLSSTGRYWFAPGVAIDGNKSVHVGFSWSNPSTSPGGVGAAVMARTSGGSWTPYRVTAAASVPFDDGTGASTASWADAGAAAVDPSSPWDVWVAGVATTSAIVPPAANWASVLNRVSLARNKASVKPSSTSVRRGTRVTFTARLMRPQSSDGVAGLPLSLQSRAKGSSRWVTLGSAKTNSNGIRKWTLAVRKTADYRTVGKKVSGGGRFVDQVTGAPVRVTVR